MNVHCLFEQSGTFKNEFKKLGFNAYDYDILNEFGETDHVIDLFKEISGGYAGEESIFDTFKSDDLIFAFFPCTRFECQVSMLFRGEAHQQQNWTDIEKLEYDLKIHKELSVNYETISKLAIIALKKNLKMIIENPANKPHYLTSYWCLKPELIDPNRRLNGDYQKKPTQYWFIGFKPKCNLILEPIEEVEERNHERCKISKGISVKTQRSLIHPQYANRFIRQYIL